VRDYGGSNLPTISPKYMVDTELLKLEFKREC